MYLSIPIIINIYNLFYIFYSDLSNNNIQGQFSNEIKDFKSLNVL